MPPVRRHIEQSAGVRETLGAARVDRIGVKNLFAKAEENTEPVLLPLDCIGDVLCFQLGLVSIIVFDRRNPLYPDTPIARKLKGIAQVHFADLGTRVACAPRCLLRDQNPFDANAQPSRA